jgi:hypothetical protein
MFKTRKTRRIEALEALAHKQDIAMQLTREYVGEAVLPEIEGWSWWDAHLEYLRVVCHR